MRLFKKLFIHSLKHYGVATAAAIAIMIFYLAPRDFAMFDFPDALKFTGLIITLVGLLILSIFYGALDTFGYAFSTFNERRSSRYGNSCSYGSSTS